MIAASDARAWTECLRKAWFGHNRPPETIDAIDPFDELLATLGREHEQRVRERLGGGAVGGTAERTQRLMREGVPLIYQAVLDDAALGVSGRPDFLRRTASGEYQAVDAKLARSVDENDGDKAHIRIQLAVYRMLLGNDQPAVAVLADFSEVTISPRADSEAREFLESMRAMLASTVPPPAIYRNGTCRACAFRDHCVPRFEAERHVSLVPGVDRRSLPTMTQRGLTTIDALAAAEPDALAGVLQLGKADTRRRLVAQARSLRDTSVVPFAPWVPPTGTVVHFDIEADSLAPEQPAVYLWGLLEPPYGRDDYRYVWSDGRADADRTAFKLFLAHVQGLRARFADLRLVHYATYERTNIASCARRFAMENYPAVTWLLGDRSPLFDLQVAVKNAFVLPVRDYGLKAICRDRRLVNFQWELEEAGSQWSIVRYQHYLRSLNAAERRTIREDLLTYNRDDVRASRALEVWARRPRADVRS